MKHKVVEDVRGDGDGYRGGGQDGYVDEGECGGKAKGGDSTGGVGVCTQNFPRQKGAVAKAADLEEAYGSR